VLDYARGFGLPATVFRMSCIYGPHQCGTEDQGWVAHFALRALAEETVFIYGDGQQVRDLLYVEDLIDAMQLAHKHIDRTTGHAFNIGGGTRNVASLLEVVEIIRSLHGRCKLTFADWRPSDQRYYVSDTRKFQQLVGWQPKVDVHTGIARMYEWLRASRSAASRASLRAAELPSSRSESQSGG
jgi:CDP-paratose 2-epimerase